MKNQRGSSFLCSMKNPREESRMVAATWRDVGCSKTDSGFLAGFTGMQGCDYCSFTAMQLRGYGSNPNG
jgi:hypothetical protein